MTGIPIRKNAIVRIKNLMADENPTTLYMVVDDPAEFEDEDRIDVYILDEKYGLSSITKIKKSDLETVPFGSVVGDFPYVKLKLEAVDEEDMIKFKKYYFDRFKKEYEY